MLCVSQKEFRTPLLSPEDLGQPVGVEIGIFWAGDSLAEERRGPDGSAAAAKLVTEHRTLTAL